MHFIEYPEDVEKMGKESLELCKNKYEVSIINRNMIDIMGV